MTKKKKKAQSVPGIVMVSMVKVMCPSCFSRVCVDIRMTAEDISVEFEKDCRCGAVVHWGALESVFLRNQTTGRPLSHVQKAIAINASMQANARAEVRKKNHPDGES